MTPRQKQNVDLVSEVIRRFASGDHAGNLALLTEECTYTIGAGGSESTVPYHGTHSGKQAVAGYLESLQTNAIRANCGGSVDDGDVIAVPPPSHSPAATPAPAPPPPAPAAPPEDHVVDPTGKILVPFADKVIVIGAIRDRFRDGRDAMHESRFAQIWTVDEANNLIAGMEMFTDTAAIMQAWQAKGGGAA